MSTKRKTGTREWAAANFNIGIGCSHDCRYCYARTNALRFKTIEFPSDWTSERVRDKWPSTSKKNGWVMFPTTHDITPFYLPSALKALEQLLEKGNNVLIVSKPHLECVKALCDLCRDYRDRVLFRFTIGTSDEAAAKFWEPGAPSIEERLTCLTYAFEKGFATSVSMEPMLGTVQEAKDLFLALEINVTDKIWIGKMNKISTRVAKDSPEVAAACDAIIDSQSDRNIMWLVNELRNHPKIEWKDSIKEVIEKYEGTVVNS